jgi:endonuclease/exonuclease/phosphatase family metal-dependent hydrolase
MPAFPKPKFQFNYTVAAEIAALRAHRTTRAIPAKSNGRLMVATWNIANFGLQQRRDEDKQLIAEIISWFDLIAVQEVRDNFADLEDVQRLLGGGYKLLFSDVAGNDERMAFIYDSSKVKLLEKIGEIGVPVSQLRHIKLKGIKQAFQGFDRNPYLATFQVSPNNSFLFVNVHLYFGSDKTPADIGRRALETFAVARWADLRRKSPFSFTREIVALGDFNMPKRDATDPVFQALTAKGLELPTHTSEVGSNLAADKHYDQIAFFPGKTKDCFRQLGVFDFDMAIFRTLWDDPNRSEADYRTYVRYYMSDHRPLWMELAI